MRVLTCVCAFAALAIVACGSADDPSSTGRAETTPAGSGKESQRALIRCIQEAVDTADLTKCGDRTDFAALPAAVMAKVRSIPKASALSTKCFAENDIRPDDPISSDTVQIMVRCLQKEGAPRALIDEWAP